jgi:hypothetical protein
MVVRVQGSGYKFSPELAPGARETASGFIIYCETESGSII